MVNMALVFAIAACGAALGFAFAQVVRAGATAILAKVLTTVWSPSYVRDVGPLERLGAWACPAPDARNVLADFVNDIRMAVGFTHSYPHRITCLTAFWPRIIFMLIVALAVARIWWSGQRVFDAVVDAFRARSSLSVKIVRESLKWPDAPKTPALSSTHDHAGMAAMRLHAIDAIAALAKKLSLPVWAESVSARERAANFLGRRGFHSPNDGKEDCVSDPVPKRCIIAGIDVDHFLDHTWFSRFASLDRAFVFFGVAPSAVAGRSTESNNAWWLEPGGQYMEVVGRTTWTHRLWNYSSDLISIPTKWSTIVYQNIVLTHSWFRQRALVALVPLYEIKLPRFALASLCAIYNRGTFLPPTIDTVGGIHVCGSYVYGTFMRGARYVVSVAHRNGRGFAVTLPFEVMRAIETALAKTSMAGVHTAVSVAAENGCKLSQAEASLIADFLRSGQYISDVVNVVTVSPEMVDIVKLPATLCAPALVPPAIAGVATPAAVEATVKARVTDPQAAPETPGPDLRDAVAEFQAQVWAAIGTDLVPHDLTDTFVRLGDTKTKVEKLTYGEITCAVEETMRVHGFTKTEAASSDYDKAALIRLLFPTDSAARRSAAISHAFGDAAKRHLPAYWVGKDPRELGAAMAAFTASCGNLLIHEADGSKADATVRETVAVMIKDLIAGSFAGTHRKSVRDQIERHFNALVKIKTTDPATTIKFKSGYMNLSGSDFTTIVNTLASMFCDYLALRRATRGAWTPQRLFAALGGHGGDDSVRRGQLADGDVTYDVDHVAAGIELGQIVKVVVRAERDPVNFYSREWPVRGSAASYALVSRFMRKLVVTCSANVAGAFGAKLMGASVSETHPLHLSLVGAYQRTRSDAELNYLGLSREETRQLAATPGVPFGADELAQSYDCIARELTSALGVKLEASDVERLTCELDAVRTLSDLEKLVISRQLPMISVGATIPLSRRDGAQQKPQDGEEVKGAKAKPGKTRQGKSVEGAAARH